MMDNSNSKCKEELNKLANAVFFNEVIDGKKTPRFGLELIATVAEALSIYVMAYLLLGYEQFEVLVVFLVAGIIGFILLRFASSFFDLFHMNNLCILNSFLKVQSNNKNNPKTVLSLIACGKLKGIVYLLKKILEDTVNSSGAVLILALVLYLLIVCVFLVVTEALVGAVPLFCLVLVGYPLSMLLQCFGWKIPLWYQRYIFLYKTCVAEYLHQKYLLFNQMFNFQFDMELFIQSITSILGGEFLGFFHFALGCLNLSRFQEITNVDQLYEFYRSLTEGELKAGGIRHIIVKAPDDADKMSSCAKDVSSGKLKLNAEKLKKLREAGLRFYVVGSHYESWKSNWWKAIYQAISPTELKTSETLFSALRRRTIFVSHRWDKTNTWHGEDSWQLEEVFNYIKSTKQEKKGLSGDVYFWMDGICVPQESEGKLSNGIDLSSLTMLVIGNLAVLVRRCGKFICIDGTRGEDRLVVEESNKYMNRAWCLYEIYHGRFLNPIQCSMDGTTGGMASGILKVSVGHDFIHGFFNSFATDLSDKLHILKTIFLRTPLLFPNITYRPLIYLFESILRQFMLMRVHRYEFLPLSKAIAISMIINHIKSMQLCQHDPNIEEYTSALLSTEVKEFLDSSCFVSHGLGYLRQYTLADLLDVIFIYEIEECEEIGTRHMNYNDDVDGGNITYILKCGIFGLLADALISIDMESKSCRLTFVHKVRVSTITEFDMLFDKMASQSIKCTKEKIKKLACSSFPIQMYEQQTDAAAEKTNSEKLNIVQEGLYSDLVSQLHFSFAKAFFFFGIYLYFIFVLIQPIGDVNDHLGRMLEATCRIIDEGCYQKQTKGIYPGLRPSLTCEVNITTVEGESWVGIAEEWGTDNGMFGYWAKSTAIESNKAVEVGNIVPCFFAEPNCPSPLSFCRSISLNRADNGEFDTLWISQYISLACCAGITFILICMLLFGELMIFSWMKNGCDFGKRIILSKPKKIAPSNFVDDVIESNSAENCSSTVKSFKSKCTAAI